VSNHLGNQPYQPEPTNALYLKAVSLLCLQEAAGLTPRSDVEVRYPWSQARRGDSERAPFYSAGSRKASGSFAQNLGLLSRRDSRREDSRSFQGERRPPPPPSTLHSGC